VEGSYVNFLGYLWKSNATRWQLVLTALFAFAFIVQVIRSFSRSKTLSEIWQWVDPFLAISTVVLALFIWHNEKKQDWENTLPKKLNIFFRLAGSEGAIYEVKNAPLAGSGDIRQWGQQIGKQMNRGELAFSGFTVTGPRRDKHNNVMRYELTI
jgi:hypothetical protein